MALFSLAQPVFPQAAVEGRFAHATLTDGFGEGEFVLFLSRDDRAEVLRWRDLRSAEADAPLLGRRDALGLALPDVLPLVLCHEGEDLQDQIPLKRKIDTSTR